MSSIDTPPISLWRWRTVAAVVLAIFAAMALALQLMAVTPTVTPVVISILTALVAVSATKVDPAARRVHRLVIGASVVVVAVSGALSLVLMATTIE
ncbi:hypothetical protein GCM10010252_56540 [Streptomyces aureoverticillatus]|nr:hypothetical protein GCM10010252_56540 [Streptomyces aureoverticillatus]